MASFLMALLAEEEAMETRRRREWDRGPLYGLSPLLIRLSKVLFGHDNVSYAHEGGGGLCTYAHLQSKSFVYNLMVDAFFYK
jgi:hypothetical protein